MLFTTCRRLWRSRPLPRQAVDVVYNLQRTVKISTTSQASCWCCLQPATATTMLSRPSSGGCHHTGWINPTKNWLQHWLWSLQLQKLNIFPQPFSVVLLLVQFQKNTPQNLKSGASISLHIKVRKAIPRNMSAWYKWNSKSHSNPKTDATFTVSSPKNMDV